MSTSTANPNPIPAPATPPVPLPRLVAAARLVLAGLVGGGLLLIILAWWLGLKFSADDRSLVIPWIIGIAGIVGLGLAGWHVFTLWLQKAPPDQQALAHSGQRRITAFVLLGGGALLLIVSLFLGFMPRPGGSGGWQALRANLGEAVGLFLFALVALATGNRLLAPPRDESHRVNLEPIRGLIPFIRVVLIALDLACIISLIVIWFSFREESGRWSDPISAAWRNVGPEVAGIILFAILCGATAGWLRSYPSPDAFQLRVIVLIFGGSTGLILFLVTLGRAIIWRTQVIGGLAGLEADQLWQFWICEYVAIFALALMLGSLLVARADVRANAILRRVVYGYTAVLNGLLLLQVLIVGNIAIARIWPYTYDWNQTRGLHALAEASKNLLHQLRQPTHVFVLMSQGMAMQSDVHTLLDNLQAESSKLEVKYISPDSVRDRLEYEELSQKFPKILPAGGRRLLGDQETGRGILIVYGAMPKDAKHTIPYAFIPERKIYDSQPGGMHGEKASRTFKGEVEVMKELNYLVHGAEKRKLYFLQGDDEIDITQMEARRRIDLTAELSLLGAASLADRLKKDNYEVEAITFSKDHAEKKKTDKIRYIGASGPDKRPELPDPKDAYAVIIAGAASPMPPDALSAIERYIDRGGRLMVLFDIVLSQDPKTKEYSLRQSGLEEMLKKYGITSTDEMAISQMVPPTRRVDAFDTWGLTPEDSDNTLAKQFGGTLMHFHTTRVLRLGTVGRFKAEPIYTTIPWRQSQQQFIIPATIAVRAPMEWLKPGATFEDLKDAGQLKARIEEALPVVAAISDDNKPRMVVFGDTEFIGNYVMRTENRTDNYSLFVSALEWMSEHPGLIGPQPKSTPMVEMPQAKIDQFTRIHGLPFWLMFLCIVGLGGGIWLVRRR